jgi:hypothetical protein
MANARMYGQGGQSAAMLGYTRAVQRAQICQQRTCLGQ